MFCAVLVRAENLRKSVNCSNELKIDFFYENESHRIDGPYLYTTTQEHNAIENISLGKSSCLFCNLRIVNKTYA